MKQSLKYLVGVVGLLLLVAACTPPNTDLSVDDFEVEELFSGSEEGTNLGIGFQTWGDFGNGAAIALAVETDDNNKVLKASVTAGGWGVGFSHAFTNEDQNAWTAQDWSEYKTLTLRFKGVNSGKTVRLDLFDNRPADSTSDNAERFFVNITDDSADWKDVSIALSDFARRTDWQPEGALDDGLTLSAVHGYAFDFGQTEGSNDFFIDSITLSK